MAGHLGPGPVPQGRAGRWLGQPAAELAVRQAGRQLAQPGAAGGRRHHRTEQHLLAHPRHEGVRRRRQHQAPDLVGVALPEELGDRATEGVADGDDRAGTELVDQGGGVIGAVGER